MNQSTVTEPEPIKHPALGKQLGLQPGDALIVVDLQRDFLPGGALAVPQADQIVTTINSYLSAFATRNLPIFLTRDWHPANHCSFKQYGGTWPPHCVQGTAGAQWPDGLQVPDSAHVVSKGSDPENDAYSGFEGTSLLDLLHTQKVLRVFVAGVATDYCVRATVLDARRYGLAVVVLAEAIRGINREHGDESRSLREMMEGGAVFFERSRGPYAHAKVPPPAKRQVYYIGDYGFGIEVTLSFETAVERVIQALRNEGFGVISDIDVTATMNSKLGVNMPPYRILGACNPPLAHRSIQTDPHIGLLLPCNVVVRRDDQGAVFIEFMDPGMLSTIVANEEIAEIASQVRRRLRHAIGWI